jgi:SAM-dependent methyltransferase
MSAFPTRQRLRRIAARGARRVLAATSEPEPTPSPQTPPPEDARRSHRHARQPLPGGLTVEHGSATQVLLDRLTPEDVAAVEAGVAADPTAAAYVATASPLDQQRLLITYGIHFEHAPLIERVGLPTAQPPDEIHSMARGPLAAAGGLYEADLVVDALASAGVGIDAIRSGLDFGCSSGRVLRVLSSAYPEIEWHGCDPNRPAVVWAAETIPGVHFFESSNEPPLGLADGSLDLVYAISIWSHFAPLLGLRWFDEMHRLLRPGGHLVFTTHGFTTVAHDAAHALRSEAQLDGIAEALYVAGAWYEAEFGDEGDWGVVNADWGTSFQTPEWLLAHLLPRWAVLEFVPGRNAGNQDLYVLRRC